jgi:hypothetical protein
MTRLVLTLTEAETNPVEKKEEEEEDPLDAFMADMSQQAKTQKSEPKVKQKDKVKIYIYILTWQRFFLLINVDKKRRYRR